VGCVRGLAVMFGGVLSLLDCVRGFSAFGCQVVALMTMGVDLSELFADIVLCSRTKVHPTLPLSLLLDS
jgi:hypothetical protein